MLSCGDHKDITLDNDNKAILNGEEYKNAPSDIVAINNVKIIKDSLLVNFSASGCHGESWELKLIGQEAVSKSLPPQRSMRLSLKNEELCEAYITKEVSFDISNFKINGNPIILNMENWNVPILYE